MLYERWTDTLRERASAKALVDASTGRSWTFGELHEAARSLPAYSPGAVAFPQGKGLQFIAAIIRAWSDRQVVCPLEPGVTAPAIPVPLQEIAHLKLTSGTTGSAKCVAFTEAQLAADADAIVATMGLSPDSPNIGAISLAHSYGFSSLVTPLLLHGIPLVLAASSLPAAVLQAARACGFSRLTIPAVPAMWKAWHDAGAIPPNTSLAISAGAPLPLQLEQDVYAAAGTKIHNFVGASECGGILYDNGCCPRTESDFAGYPLLGVEVRRSDDGCMEVKSSGVGTGYWPVANQSLENGIYRSHDLVEIAPSGGVHLRGRIDDLINVAGRKVAPGAIEEALRTHPDVRECLVLGISAGEYRGHVIAAVVELSRPQSEAGLRDHLLAKLPEWQVPRVWHFASTIAPNGRGKLSRKEWRERILAAPGQMAPRQ